MIGLALFEAFVALVFWCLAVSFLFLALAVFVNWYRNTSKPRKKT